jgi:hypothetical protein
MMSDDASAQKERISSLYNRVDDEQEWWSARWTHGSRYPLEKMPSKALEPFASEVKTRPAPLKQQDGFHELWRILCMLATKPAM